MQNLVIAGSGTPSPGNIGVLWQGGYNINADDVFSVNHDTCLKWLAIRAYGISFHGKAVDAGACQRHYVLVDGRPELTLENSRYGLNNAGDYAATDYISLTNTACTGAGCGPNTIDLTDDQFNSGTLADGPACFMSWAGFIHFPAVSEYKLSNVHMENLATGGAAFCSDRTVRYIHRLQIANSEFSQDNAGVHLFALNSNTALTQTTITGSVFLFNDLTLSPNPARGQGYLYDQFIGNMFPPASFTTNKPGTDELTLVGNHYAGSLTLAGDWLVLTAIGETANGAFTNSTTGGVTIIGNSTTPLPAGAAAKYVCVTSGGLIIQSATPC
ncbi:MAG TPA: hypothetical protein VGM07_06040 [Stellaceae bacterium]